MRTRTMYSLPTRPPMVTSADHSSKESVTARRQRARDTPCAHVGVNWRGDHGAAGAASALRALLVPTLILGDFRVRACEDCFCTHNLPVSEMNPRTPSREQLRAFAARRWDLVADEKFALLADRYRREGAAEAAQRPKTWHDNGRGCTPTVPRPKRAGRSGAPHRVEEETGRDSSCHRPGPRTPRSR